MHNLPIWLAKYKESLSKEKLHHAYLLYGREGLGKENFTAYTMDLTKKYIEINADYKT